MFSAIVLSLISFGLQSPIQANANSEGALVSISGTCWDASSGEHLNAKTTVLYKSLKSTLSNSGQDETFNAQIPDSARFFVFEMKGYKTVTAPLNFIGKMDEGSRFSISIPMVRLDSQQVRRAVPFMVRKKHAGSPMTNSKSKVVFFEIKEATEMKTLTAKVCLTYAKSGRTQCVNTDSTKLPVAVLLEKEDDISISVSATGHQTYSGKLIISGAAEDEVFYQIRLLKELNPLAMFFDVPENLDFSCGFTQNGQYRTSFDFPAGQHLSNLFIPWFVQTNDEANASFEFSASTKDGSQDMKTRMNYKPGINFLAVRLKPVEKKLTEDVQNVEVGTGPWVSTGKTLYFDQSDYNLRRETKATLDSISILMADQKNLTAIITGHTDNVGKHGLNVILSEYRARVVVNYLQQKGVRSDRIVITWKGPDAPVAPNDTDYNKIKNRRVEIELSVK